MKSIKNINKANKSLGFTLIELMLALVILSIMAASTFYFLDKAKVSANVQKETEIADQVISVIAGNFGAVGRFQDVSVETVSALNGIPKEIVVQGALTSRFGGTITPAPHRILEDNDAFSLTYSDLDVSECLKFVQAVQQRTSSIEAGTSLDSLTIVQPIAASGDVSIAEDARVDTIQLTQVCSQDGFKSDKGFVKLIIYSGRSGVGLAAPPTACSCVNGQKETALNPCPVGQVGAVTQSRSGLCSGGTADCPTNVWGPWTTLSNTCAPAPAQPTPPPGVPVVTTPCIPETQSRTKACPAGMIGTILESKTSSCPAATGNPIWSNVWVEMSNTCVMLSGTCKPTVTTDPNPPSCPTGQCGSIVRQKTFTCDASGNFVPPSPDVWTITQNTCIDENSPNAFCATAKPKCVAAPVRATGQCSTGQAGCIDCGSALESGNGTVFQLMYKNPPGEFNSSCVCSQGGTLTSNGPDASGDRLFSCSAPNAPQNVGTAPASYPQGSQFAWNPTTGAVAVWDTETGARSYTLSQPNTAVAYCPGDRVSRRFNGVVNTVTVTRGANFKSLGSSLGWEFGYCMGVEEGGGAACKPEAKIPVASAPEPDSDQVGCFSGVSSGSGLMGGGFGQEDQLCSKCTKFSADGRTCESCAGDLRTVYCQ